MQMHCIVYYINIKCMLYEMYYINVCVCVCVFPFLDI